MADEEKNKYDPLIFNSGKEYMTKQEAAAVVAFMADLPKPKTVYVKNGKKQIVSMYKLPVGSFIEGVSKHVGVPDPPDGTFYYTTPLARLEFKPNSNKNVKVWVKDVETEEGSIITGDQWLKFASGATEVPYSPELASAFGMGKADRDAYLDNLKIENSQQVAKEKERKAVELALAGSK